MIGQRPLGVLMCSLGDWPAPPRCADVGPSGLEQNSGLISLDLGTAPTAASAACLDVSAARQVRLRSDYLYAV